MSEPLATASRPAAPPAGSAWRHSLAARLQRRDVQRLIMNITIILVIGTYVHANTGLFWTVRNWQAISVQIAVVTIVAVAMTLVMIAGHIDASVSGTVVLGGITAGLLITHGFPVWLAFLAATLVGGAVGLLNAFLVVGVGITSLIATIGTLYGTLGFANILTNGLPVAGLPQEFRIVGQGTIVGVPIALPMILLIVGVFAAIQGLTLFGRWVVAVGSNSRAAYLNGVNVTRTTVLCFVLTGLAAGWGGIMYASRLGNPAPSLDNGLLFSVIVAIVIGGTSLQGGQGSVIGTFVGAILIGTVNNALNLLGISTFYYYISLGVLLVASVGFDTALRRDSVHVLRRTLLGRVRPAAGAETDPVMQTVPGVPRTDPDAEGGEVRTSPSDPPDR
jgi:ribose/xylose/arabinose/galactoside ABC-type transport system permease subunit